MFDIKGGCHEAVAIFSHGPLKDIFQVERYQGKLTGSKCSAPMLILPPVIRQDSSCIVAERIVRWCMG